MDFFRDSRQTCISLTKKFNSLIGLKRLLPILIKNKEGFKEIVIFNNSHYILFIKENEIYVQINENKKKFNSLENAYNFLIKKRIYEKINFY